MEELEKFKKELDDLGSQIDKKLEDHSKKWGEYSKEVKEAVMAELKPDMDKHNAMADKFLKIQEQLDNIDTKIQRLPFGSKEAKKGFADSVKEVLVHLKEKGNGSIRNYLAEKGRTGEIELKIDDMTQANSFESTAVVQAQHVPGIKFDPDTTFRVRDLIAPGTTNSNSIEYVVEHALTDSTDVTAEGSEYKQSDFDLKLKTATVRKITAYIIVSEEMLEDVEGLNSYISLRLPSKLKLKENYQLLYGDGLGINLSGLTANATAYVDELADSDISEIDVLVSAMKQVRTSEYNPTFALIHPTDALKIKLTKDDNGNYIQPWIFMGNGDITLDGVRIIVSSAITSGDFLVGDGGAAQVFDRRQMTLEMTNTNEDNFVKGMVTVRISERITIAVYRPKGFIYGTFAAALANGSA